MSRWFWVAIGFVTVIVMAVAKRSVDSGRSSGGGPGEVASSENMGSFRLAAGPSSEAAHRFGMHTDAQRSAEIRLSLLELNRGATRVNTDVGDGPSAQPVALAPGRLTEDVEAYSGFIHEHIQQDFAPMAKGCYQDLLRREPTAHGDVIVGFTILGDPSVGGVVDSADVREESTLRDPSLETCLRESFLSVYFDPPPKGSQITMRYPFHFEGGEVNASHDVHLADKRD
jgi:hypothetical protein